MKKYLVTMTLAIAAISLNAQLVSPDLMHIRIKENPSETLEYVGKIGSDFDTALDSLRKLKVISSEITKEPLEVIFDYDDRSFFGIVYGDCAMYSDVLDTKGYYYLRTWYSPEESFEPMLKEGRVWNCTEVYLGEEKNDTITCEYRIEGTSEIDGHICYNLCLGSKVVDRYYEEGSKVFRYTASGPELLFDFSLSPGDVVPGSGGLVVEEVKTIVMEGVSRRCLYFPLTAVDGTQLCWIEGIGCSMYGPIGYNNVVIGSLLSVKLSSVYDGDVCIFDPDDLMTKTVEINETTFPDENFRNWVLTHFYYSADSVLTEQEIANIKFIDVSGKGIKTLKGIEYLTAMTSLECSNNQLTELDISKNKALMGVDCSHNQLTSIKASGSTALEELVCADNQLTSLDVSKCRKLEFLYCERNQLTTLDVSECEGLQRIYCENNRLTTVDVTGCPALEHLYSDSNQLTSLDLSKNKKLISLSCSDNQLTSLNVSMNSSIYWLAFNQNRIAGAGMDALLESLPTVINHNTMNVLSAENEQNVMTKTQVAAAKAKGWTPLHHVGGYSWQEYEGSDPVDPVTFTTDQMATIILPTKPDAGKGKYYRLDRVEDGQIVFEQEQQPRARVPYIIVPDEDFSIDPETLELAGLSADTVTVGGIRFIGTYCREVLSSPEGEGEGSFYYDIIDQTPDCSLSPSEETGKGAVVGALRAYLEVCPKIVGWDDPYHPGGTRVPRMEDEKMKIVLKDKGTGSLTPNPSPRRGEVYDLQGRKLPLKGVKGSAIYILNGRKVLE